MWVGVGAGPPGSPAWFARLLGFCVYKGFPAPQKSTSNHNCPVLLLFGVGTIHFDTWPICAHLKTASSHCVSRPTPLCRISTRPLIFRYRIVTSVIRWQSPFDTSSRIDNIQVVVEKGRVGDFGAWGLDGHTQLTGLVRLNRNWNLTLEKRFSADALILGDGPLEVDKFGDKAKALTQTILLNSALVSFCSICQNHVSGEHSHESLRAIRNFGTIYKTSVLGGAKSLDKKGRNIPRFGHGEEVICILTPKVTTKSGGKTHLFCPYINTRELRDGNQNTFINILGPRLKRRPKLIFLFTLDQFLEPSHVAHKDADRNRILNKAFMMLHCPNELIKSVSKSWKPSKITRNSIYAISQPLKAPSHPSHNLLQQPSTTFILAPPTNHLNLDPATSQPETPILESPSPQALQVPRVPLPVHDPPQRAIIKGNAPPKQYPQDLSPLRPANDLLVTHHASDLVPEDTRISRNLNIATPTNDNILPQHLLEPVHAHPERQPLQLGPVNQPNQPASPLLPPPPQFSPHPCLAALVPCLLVRRMNHDIIRHEVPVRNNPRRPLDTPKIPPDIPHNVPKLTRQPLSHNLQPPRQTPSHAPSAARTPVSASVPELLPPPPPRIRKDNSQIRNKPPSRRSRVRLQTRRYPPEARQGYTADPLQEIRTQLPVLLPLSATSRRRIQPLQHTKPLHTRHDPIPKYTPSLDTHLDVNTVPPRSELNESSATATTAAALPTRTALDLAPTLDAPPSPGLNTAIPPPSRRSTGKRPQEQRIRAVPLKRRHLDLAPGEHCLRELSIPRQERRDFAVVVSGLGVLGLDVFAVGGTLPIRVPGPRLRNRNRRFRDGEIVVISAGSGINRHYQGRLSLLLLIGVSFKAVSKLPLYNKHYN
ncbi:hypothetical protein CCUS01_13032 [Colletotrichum cuscutae]|uniref:Uncharacterized protein n=1 Tax=Colletotrichum cuscutae TaxID=1209917 RepID=A0AAI9YCT1_9PEZI|nr:hypothetical protein CCUS01_13032 [Colletotrichum cuscutae]